MRGPDLGADFAAGTSSAAVEDGEAGVRVEYKVPVGRKLTSCREARDAVGLARSVPRPVRIEREVLHAGNWVLALHWPVMPSGGSV